LPDGYPENKVLNFMRENVSWDQIREVEEKLALNDSGDLDRLLKRQLRRHFRKENYFRKFAMKFLNLKTTSKIYGLF